MQRSSRLGRLLALAGVAVWLGSPPSLSQAQPRKAGPDAGPAGKAPVAGLAPPPPGHQAGSRAVGNARRLPPPASVRGRASRRHHAHLLDRRAAAVDPLYHQGPLREIKKVSFIGPDGEEIQARASGSGQSGSVHQAYYSLARRVETCTIRLTVPETIETVTMAVAIDTGVGFPPGLRRRILPAPVPRRTVIGAAPR